MVEKLLESLGYLIILSHAMPQFFTHHSHNCLTEILLKLFHFITANFQTYLHFWLKCFNQSCCYTEFYFLKIFLLKCLFQLNDIPSISFLRNRFVKLKNTLSHCYVIYFKLSQSWGAVIYQRLQLEFEWAEWVKCRVGPKV